MRGIGEKFGADPATGTGTMRISLPLSGSRSGFGPQFSIAYNSLAGNGPFGLGWELDLPSVSRVTDRGLPRYRDADDTADEDADTFRITGLDDLVRVHHADGTQRPDDEVAGHRVRRYRPRTEGSFTRVERWTRIADGDVHWRTLTSSNVLAVYGQDTRSRVYDPQNDRRVFRWLLCETRDDVGNAVLYDYVPENADDVDVEAPNEKGRAHGARTANRYLKRVRYGNVVPFLDDHGRRPVDITTNQLIAAAWLFELVLDYGEHDPHSPMPRDDERPETRRPARPDAFSTNRPGFEVRTYRLCHRALLFHHFPHEADIGDNYLVGALEFEYDLSPTASLLTSATQIGYLRTNDGYEAQATPPLTFEYSRATIDPQVHRLDADDIPHGLGSPDTPFIDLDGDGLTGALTEQGGGWFYAPNLGQGRFGPLCIVDPLPVAANLNTGRQAMLDLDGDGRLDLVTLAEEPAGFHERTEGGWAPFVPFTERPTIDWGSPALQFVDLTGDGLADVLIADEGAYRWHPGHGNAGFGRAMPVSPDPDGRPAIGSSNADFAVALADMSGDGLNDLVRISNTEICYWPNLGYGRFGTRLVMLDSPRFDQSGQFDPARLRLADLDGSGTVDVVYLGAQAVTVWFNQCGNDWSAPIELPTLPHVDNVTTIQVADLLGNGTACLVWSSPLLPDAPSPVRYVDLMGGTKPYLLTVVTNNVGGLTRINYASSTRFFLADRRNGRPWATCLPFPVHVVECIEHLDLIAGTRFTNRYEYHHGHYDGHAREFCGFAAVDQHDTETYDDFKAAVEATGGTQEPDPLLFQPPVTTRSWFHTGAWNGGVEITHQLAHEYYLELRESPGTSVPEGLDTSGLHDCVRALRGLPLRREVYSFDRSAHERHPYQVTEYGYDVLGLQDTAAGRHGVFQVVARETLTRIYDRDPADPRVEHKLVLALGEFGIPVETATITYGRTVPGALPAGVIRAQQQLHVSIAQIDLTPSIDRPGAGTDPGDEVPAFRLPVAYQGHGYELTGVTPAGVRFTRAELRKARSAATPIEYEVVADGATVQERLLSRTRTLFLSDGLAVLPLGQWDTLGLSHRSFQLAFTPGVVTTHYADSLTMQDWLEAGYVRVDGADGWWIPSGTHVYPPNPAANFFMPIGVRDASGIETLTTLDRYHLLPNQVQVTQAPWMEVRAVNDYRILGPVQLTDPNRNRSAVRYDALGRVAASALMGKEGARQGDTLDDPTTRTEYEDFAWLDHGTPTFTRTFHRVRHASEPGPVEWRQGITYVNGNGGTAMSKVQAAPGKALRANPDGTTTEVDADPRWLCTGRTVLNNKGNPVKQYEPFFSPTADYDDEEAVRAVGRTAIRHYDPIGRLVRVDNADGTFVRASFTPWSSQVEDANDTVLDSRWFAEHGSPDPAAEPEPADPDRRAAWLAARHADTADIVHFDGLGRPVLNVSDDGDHTVTTRSSSDLTGRYTTLFDQLGRKVAEGFAGMIGTPILSTGPEKGTRRTFFNARGQVVRAWDTAGRVYRTEYDHLNRPAGTFASAPGGPEIRLANVVYGEQHPQAVARNLLGTVHQVFDSAGMTRVLQVDLAGNPTALERRLTSDHHTLPDWKAAAAAADYDAIQAAAAPSLDTESFTASSAYDALGRPTQVTLPGGTVILPSYDLGSMLSRLQVRIGGQGPLVDYLKSQDYDAKGQRRSALYGNDVLLSYVHDPDSFRLTELLAVRAGSPDANSLQHLRYTYDAVGNLVEARDDAQATHFFSNAVVKALWRFSYDALYRLVTATGRELAGGANDTIRDSGDLAAVPQLPHVNDINAVRNYAESYEYDDLGNLLRLVHAAPAAGGSWTRRYRYAYQDDASDMTNRLAATSLPGDPDNGPYTAKYDHDDRGNLMRLRLPNPGELRWDLLDRLSKVDLGGGGTAYYCYGSDGSRTRKIIERPGGRRTERIYLGAVEIYRERQGNGPVRLERHTVHVSDTAGRIAQVDIKLHDDDSTDPINPLGTPLVRYQYGNHLGSAVLETDEHGNPISYEEYHPFGTTAYRSGKPTVNLSLKRYRFAGRERDDETGLYYGGARYFAPWLGRWISADPSGFTDGLNLYVYCGNNPVVVHDPSGRDSITLLGKPPSIQAAQRTPSPQAGVRYEAWVRSQTFNVGGNTFRVSPGTGTLRWTGRYWTIEGAEFAKVSEPVEDGDNSGGGIAAGAGPAAGPAPANGPGSGGVSGTVTAPSSGGGTALLVRPMVQDAPNSPVQITPIPKVDLPQAPPGTNFKAAEAAGRANARAFYPHGPGEQAQHYLKWRVGRDTNLDPKITNDVRYMRPIQSWKALSNGPYTANGRTFNTPHTWADQGVYFEHEREVQNSAWNDWTTERTQHVETGRRTMNTVEGTRGPVPPYIFGGTLMGIGGTMAVGLVRGLVPLVAEAEMGFAGISVWAYGTGHAALGAASASAAAYTPLIAGSAVAGSVAGNYAEYGMSKLTDNRDAQLAAGVIGAAAAGAGIGALIGSVVPIAGTVIGAGAGAAIGAAAGLAAYLISKYW
ncbi:SpvB/TcaC N-terminal domain-containing protein [Streptomyces tendae]